MQTEYHGSVESTNQDAGAGHYQSRLAERIKGLRTRRGMTRKLLSHHSSISERYLSRVECGQANISVALLWRIAEALDVEVHELLPDYEQHRLPGPVEALWREMTDAQVEQALALLRRHFASGGEPVRGVALIGLRGAGKSELGRRLSEETGVPFFDLVAVIEEVSGLEVGDLFSLGGQKTYRRYERQALESVLSQAQRAIVEAGGSLVTQTKTYRMLLDNYHTVWLKAEPAEHMERVVAQGDFRPMRASAEAMADLKRMLSEREREYQAAHHVISTSGRGLAECYQDLLEHCKPYLC